MHYIIISVDNITRGSCFILVQHFLLHEHISLYLQNSISHFVKTHSVQDMCL